MSINDVLTSEDIEFLCDLGNELKTQDNCGNAKPLFFMIREERKVFGVDFDYSDGEVLAISEEPVDFYDVSAAKKAVAEWYEIPMEDMSECESLSTLHEFLDEHEIINTYTGYKDDEKFSNAFLTKRACEKHIRLNHYHYKDGRPYADTAWRNPEFERLLSIVEKFATLIGQEGE